MTGDPRNSLGAAAARATASQDSSGETRAVPVIVIIDDRVTNRDILAKLASSLDEETVVQTFSNPQAALDWIAEHTPDLVITDYKMPSMDGASFIRKLRGLPLCADVPVIVVTVYEDRDFRYKALEAGATDFLLSPLDHYEFRARAHNLLTLRKQQEIIKKRAHILERKLRSSDDLRREELRESEEKLRQVTDSIPAMIYVTDQAGLCTFINSYQAHFFGIDADDCVGRPLAELFGDDYAARHLNLDQQVFETGESISGAEETLISHEGDERTFLTTKTPLRGVGGQFVNVVTVAVDISDRKVVERALQEAKEIAEAGNRTKTEFLASMSHELRTPLNAVMGFADVMRVQMLGPIGSPKYLEYAEDIRASAEHLLHIINDMLDVSAIESGKLDLIETNVDVERTIDDVIRLIKGRADGSAVTIDWRDGANLPQLLGDARRLKQVLINILSNSIKFTPPGGRITLATSLENGGLKIVVADTGIGIAEEDIPTAKARFGRIESAANRKYPGTGLGLTLAIELMKLHGGDLDITSAVGKGTTVTLSFPPERTLPAAQSDGGSGG